MMMLNNLRVILLLIVFIGCSSPIPVKIRDCDGREDKLVEFVSACIKDANPKSDEEPEDWIKQCRYTAIEIICKEVDGFKWTGGCGSDRGRFAEFKCDDAKSTREKALCNE